MLVNFKELNEYYRRNGFHYEEELLFNIQMSLKTKPFLILSGISGTGKSKIIDIYADYLSKKMGYIKNYSLLPVRPNWIDNKFVFGFHNIIDDTYSITPIVKIFIEALQNKNKPYFIILDEMNMAKVEHYFSDFLSVLESRKKKKINVDEIKNIEVVSHFFRIRESITISQAIILSALDLTSLDLLSPKVFEIKDLRNNRFSRVLGLVNDKVNPDGSERGNWFAHYRSEVNQGVNRVANRFFDQVQLQGSRHPRYKWKDKNQLSQDDAKILDELIEKHRLISKIFDDYNITDHSIQSTQRTIEFTESETLNLHNNNRVLPVSSLDNENNIKIQKKVEEENLKAEYLYYSNNLYDKEKGNYYVPPTMPIPMNVYIVGTVNVDETTYTFSNKVLDRANVIEFNEVDILKALGEQNIATSSSSLYLKSTLLDLETDLATLEDTEWLYVHHKDYFNIILRIFNILEEENLHFGYRTFNEISSYIKNSAEYFYGTPIETLDNQILQKILPKINGDIEELRNVLENLLLVVKEEKLKKSEQKIERMITDLERNGFTTFIK